MLQNGERYKTAKKIILKKGRFFRFLTFAVYYPPLFLYINAYYCEG